MSKITIGGVVATVIYVAGVSWYLATGGRNVAGLELNEFGDFLAGVFGPLAFFWLICGYLQQGVELRQNTQALELQVAELRNSVQHQQDLVAETRRHVDADLAEMARNRDDILRRALPVFDATPSERIMAGGGMIVEVALTNAGGEIMGATFSRPEQFEIFEAPSPVVWKRYDEKTVMWVVESEVRPENFTFSMFYVDGQGIEGKVDFDVDFYLIDDPSGKPFITTVEVRNPKIVSSNSRGATRS